MTAKANRVIAKKIVELRKKEGLTREKVAFGADLSKTTITKLEEGVSDPRISTLEKLAIFFNVPLKNLFP
jgi:transcriptional regulator with XRE-family HTH domain